MSCWAAATPRGSTIYHRTCGSGTTTTLLKAVSGCGRPRAPGTGDRPGGLGEFDPHRDAPMKIATAQTFVSTDLAANGAEIRSMIEKAADAGAGLVLFCEGAL